VTFRRAQWRGRLKELKTAQLRRVPIAPLLVEALKASLAAKGEAQARADAAKDSAEQSTGTEG